MLITPTSPNVRKTSLCRDISQFLSDFQTFFVTFCRSRNFLLFLVTDKYVLHLLNASDSICMQFSNFNDFMPFHFPLPGWPNSGFEFLPQQKTLTNDFDVLFLTKFFFGSCLFLSGDWKTEGRTKKPHEERKTRKAWSCVL